MLFRADIRSCFMFYESINEMGETPGFLKNDVNDVVVMLGGFVGHNMIHHFSLIYIQGIIHDLDIKKKTPEHFAPAFRVSAIRFSFRRGGWRDFLSLLLQFPHGSP